MASQQSTVRITFGPFELNTATGELFKSGIRVRLPAQPFAILVLLLQNRGAIVTRDQLREQVWGDGTFVDFEHGLNSAMNKLRTALGDSAEKPRYIETIPGRGYRFLETVPAGAIRPVEAVVAAPQPVVVEPKVAEQNPVRLRSLTGWERTLWIALLLACVAVALWFRNRPSPELILTLRRVTADAGLSAHPALSPDGSLMAYTSEGSLKGDQDLYVRHVAGGQPVRLTFDGAGNSMPNFSPDGSKIVFRSGRNGGGIFEIAALGGDARLLARDGLDPKYSPDGTLVAYWVGTSGVSSAVPGSGTVWVVPVSGGAPRRVGEQFTAARQPIWLPDGKRLLFIAYTSAKPYESSAVDWWVAPVDGGPAVPTGLFDVLVQAGMQARWSKSRPAPRPPVSPSPGCWLASSQSVLFSMASEDVGDLWEIGISERTGKVVGTPRRLTASTVRELYPSCARNGLVAFTGIETSRNVWSLPFDLNRGVPLANGAFEPLTTGPSFREHASLANDSRRVAFASNQSGRFNIWIRDLIKGTESQLASSALEQHYPVISPSGDKVAFSLFEKDGRSVYAARTGAPSERVCEDCFRATDWSRDEKSILVFAGGPYEIDEVNLATRQRRAILKDPSYNFIYGQYSPDGRWVSFTARSQGTTARIAIAPLDGTQPVPESAWMTIAEATGGDWANWSPDGQTLYYTSSRDGHSCFWGQRISTASRRLIGEPFPVLHLHGHLYYQPGTMWAGWSARGNRIAMVLAEDTGNIWTMSRSSVPQ